MTPIRPALRIGGLRYLNALPLVDGLETHALRPQVHYEIPSLLARDLRASALDLALVPQVEATRDADYRIVPDICISCLGAVDSILLFTRRKWPELRRVGVDCSSNTSVELLRVIFHLRGLPPPELVAIPPRLDALRSHVAQDAQLDAVLLIGDRALAEDTGEYPRFDLGATWHEATGLPFVFAVWLGRREMPTAAAELVTEIYQRNLSRRAELARQYCREHPDVIDSERARRYLEDRIRYQLGAAELESMRVFHGLRATLSDLDPAWRPRFF
ncbi:MAG: menaquinone biosynthetic enzyme MqnA/MqnD family protein [Planctomycetota bacterium]